MHLVTFYLFSAAVVAFGENVYKMEVPQVQQGPVTSFKWSNCNTTAVPLAFSSFSIHPDSVKVGSNVFISFDVEVTKDIGTTKTLQADLEVTLTTQGTPIDLCRYDPVSKFCHIEDLCKVLADHVDKCPELIKKLGTDCKCPLKEKTYSVKNAIYHVPQVPIEGLFHAKVNVTESNKPVGCIELDICIGTC